MSKKITSGNEILKFASSIRGMNKKKFFFFISEATDPVLIIRFFFVQHSKSIKKDSFIKRKKKKNQKQKEVETKSYSAKRAKFQEFYYLRDEI